MRYTKLQHHAFFIIVITSKRAVYIWCRVILLDQEKKKTISELFDKLLLQSKIQITNLIRHLQTSSKISPSTREKRKTKNKSWTWLTPEVKILDPINFDGFNSLNQFLITWVVPIEDYNDVNEELCYRERALKVLKIN